MSYFNKFKGQRANVPPMPQLKQVVVIWFGALLASGTIGFLAWYSGQPLILGSFGASIFVLFILPDTPFAQPRNVIGGHLVATFIGLLFFHFVGAEWWSMALSLATALTAMQLLRIPHPPAGSNPFIVFLAGAGWDFLFMPTLLGCVLLIVITLFYNNLIPERVYPKYWF